MVAAEGAGSAGGEQPGDDAHNKYVSERAGRRYPVLVGIIGVLFFFGQMVVPAVAMFAFMPGLFLASWEVPRLDDGAVHRGAFYYPVRSVEFDERKGNRSVLHRFEPGGDAPERLGGERVAAGARLVSAGGALWVVSRARLARLRQGRLETVSSDAPLGTISRPFAWRDRPAVLESRPDGYWLRVYRDGAWQTGPRLDLTLRGRSDLDLSALDAVEAGGALHLFLEFEDGLYHRRIDPDRPDVDGGSWDAVTGEEHRWSPTVVDDVPVVFYTVPDDNAFRRPIRARRLTPTGWETILELPGATGGDMLVMPGSRPDRFDVLTHGPFQGPTLLRMEAGAIRDRVETGEGLLGGVGGRIVGWMVSMVAIMQGSQLVLPLLLIVILSYMMFRYRVTTFAHDHETVPYASLLRRAVARGVDLLIMGFPVLVGGLYVLLRFFRRPDPRLMIWLFAVWGLGILWALGVMVVYAFLEGRRGKTPGKWLTGIRVVGTDLEFCGFGRALIRNLLMFVDGFFNFLVGVLMIALTEHWQRLGDYAADTVVLRDEEGHAPPASGKRSGGDTATAPSSG